MKTRILIDACILCVILIVAILNQGTALGLAMVDLAIIYGGLAAFGIALRLFLNWKFER